MVLFISSFEEVALLQTPGKLDVSFCLKKKKKKAEGVADKRVR